MSVGLLLLQLGLGAMFVASGVSKLLQADEFAAALRLSRLPEPLVVLLTAAVPLLEIGLSAWLFMASPEGLPKAFLACVALLALFTAWMLWVGARKLTVRCGCFGGGGGYVGSRTVSRNLALIGFALSGWQLTNHAASPLSGISLGSVIAWSSLAMAVALLQAARFAMPHMTLTFEQFRNAGTAEME